MSVQPTPVDRLQMGCSMSGRSVSNPTCLYCWVLFAPVVGLVNLNGVGWILVLPLGHSRWYEAPSNPLLVKVQPDTLYVGPPGKQKMSSPSGADLLAPRPSW